MWEILQLELFHNAILTGLLVSVICGIIGSLVVANRIVFLAGGIAHAAYGGIGLALFLGLPFLITTLGYTIVCAWIMAVVTLKTDRQRADAVIGVLWAGGMAVGVILLNLSPGYNMDAMSFLFGGILAVPREDLGVIALANVLTILIVWYYYHGFAAVSFDVDFAQVRGVSVKKLYFLMIAIIAVSVVLAMRVVGLILVLALLTIPPLIVERHSGSLKVMMFWSVCLCAFFTTGGLGIAFVLDLPAGATIILVAVFGYLLIQSSIWFVRYIRIWPPDKSHHEPTDNKELDSRLI